MKLTKTHYLIIWPFLLFPSFILNENCSDFIEQFSEYKCESEHSFISDSSKTVFKVSKNGKLFNLVVKDNYPDCEQEVATQMTLAAIPNIEEIIDSAEDENGLTCVSIRTNAFNLQSFLQNPENLKKKSDKLIFIKQIAEALQKVHSKNLVHLNLQLHNILIDEHNHPLLTGFEDSKVKDSVGVPTDVGFFHPPEIGRLPKNGEAKMTAAVDMFQLGIFIYFLFRQALPFSTKKLDYEDWINTPITFQKGNNFTFYELVYNTLTMEKNRISDDSMVDLLSEYIQNPKTMYFPKTYKYYMDSDKRITVEDLFELNHLQNMEHSLKQEIHSNENGQDNILLAKKSSRQNQIEEEEAWLMGWKTFVVSVGCGALLIVGIIVLICKKWTSKSKISKKFVKKQIKLNKTNSKSKEMIALDQSLTDVHI